MSQRGLKFAALRQFIRATVTIIPHSLNYIQLNAKKDLTIP